MSIIVTDTGFGADDWAGGYSDLDSTGVTSVDIGPDTAPDSLADAIPTLKMIRVDFPSFADGRGFTIARQLRRIGYTGRLRARGHVLQINMPWPGAPALTRSKSTTTLRGVNHRTSGWPGPTGGRMTISLDCAARHQPEKLQPRGD